MAFSNRHPDFHLKSPKEWAGTITVSMVQDPMELKYHLDNFVEFFTTNCNWSFRQRLDCGFWAWGTLVCYDAILCEGDVTVVLLSFFDQDGTPVGSEHTWLVPSTSFYDDVNNDTFILNGESLRNLLFDEMRGLESSTQKVTPFTPPWLAQYDRLVNAHNRGFLTVSPKPFNGHELPGQSHVLPDISKMSVHESSRESSTRYISAADLWSKKVFKQYGYEWNENGTAPQIKYLDDEVAQMEQDRYHQRQALASGPPHRKLKERVQSFEEFANLSWRVFEGRLDEPALHTETSDVPGLSYFQLRQPLFEDAMKPSKVNGMTSKPPAGNESHSHASSSDSEDSSCGANSPAMDTIEASEVSTERNRSDQNKADSRDQGGKGNDSRDRPMECDVACSPPSPRPAPLPPPPPRLDPHSPPPLRSTPLMTSSRLAPLPAPSPRLTPLDDDKDFEEDFGPEVELDTLGGQLEVKTEPKALAERKRKPIPPRQRAAVNNLNQKEIAVRNYALLRGSFMFLEHRQFEAQARKRKQADRPSPSVTWSSSVDWSKAFPLMKHPSTYYNPLTVRLTGWRRSCKTWTYDASGEFKYEVGDSSPIAEISGDDEEFLLGGAPRTKTQKTK